MSDQTYLEMTEARELLVQYRINRKQTCTQDANAWLQMALKVSERKFGRGAADRIKTHMRNEMETFK